MGKLKEKLLNNLTPEEENEMFELSAFEYVEYMENYKQQNEEIPNDVAEQIAAEREQLEKQFIEHLHEFNSDDYINHTANNQIIGGYSGGIVVDANWGDEQSEIDEINDSIELKYSDSDVIMAIKAVKDENWFINRVLRELRVINNNRKGYE